MLAALALTLAAAQTAGEPARPNVVFILADDLGFGDLSVQAKHGGADEIQTPHIDSIFADGLTFTNFYANCTVCSPTRAALMTGRFPASVGVPGVVRPWAEDNWGYLSPHAELLPQRLKSAGYGTALIGKWHLGGESHNGTFNAPAARGFHSFRGFRGGMLDSYTDYTRRFPGEPGPGPNMMTSDGAPVPPGEHATDLFSDWAVDAIEAEGDTRSPAAAAEREPFFLYLAYNAPHTPVQPPAEWVAKVKARESGIAGKRAKLVALIEHMDAGVGRVLDALGRAGLAGNTLVVFTSDNGGLLGAGADNGPFRGGKEDLYQGGLRVPCGARWPGVIGPGAATDVRAVTMDWFPTLLAAAGVEAPAGIDGVSLLPVLRGDGGTFPDDRALHFTRREGRPAVWAGKTGDAVIAGDWKLVQNRPFDRRELFDLAADPGETTDLADANRDKLLELSRLMQDRQRRDGAVPWEAPAAAE